MPYSSNSLASLAVVTALQDAPWYPSHAVTNLLTYLGTVDMSSQTSRFEALNAIKALPSTSPYSIVDGDPSHPQPIRFSALTPVGVPSPSFFAICRDYSVWHGIFTDLQASLTPPPCFIYILDPAVPRFYAAVEAYTHALTMGFGLFNYITFESNFALNWS